MIVISLKWRRKNPLSFDNFYYICPHCNGIMTLNRVHSDKEVKTFLCNCNISFKWGLLLDKEWYEWIDGDWHSVINLPKKKYYSFMFR